MISLLHIFLNSRETLFQIYYFFFEMLYHNLFEDKKILSQKPKQTVINLILHLTYHGWKNIYAILFKSRFFKGYLESIVKIWTLFQRLRKHNFNKVSLIFLSDVFY